MALKAKAVQRLKLELACREGWGLGMEKEEDEVRVRTFGLCG